MLTQLYYYVSYLRLRQASSMTISGKRNNIKYRKMQQVKSQTQIVLSIHFERESYTLRHSKINLNLN